ncbi:hypothetical protein [Corynebacterium frankenforstense]|uniref:hypothetical protein n=1 Tax=Corynebacterium frankenforstense TaxID=1230998 RepID=UPI0026EBF175|nr:hypothetical protein [Corynebacterium frankenforstense]
MSRAALRRRLTRVGVDFRRRAVLAVCVTALGVGAAACAGQAGAGNGAAYGPEPAPGTVAATARDAAAESSAGTVVETAGYGAAPPAGPETSAAPPGPGTTGGLRVFDDGTDTAAVYLSSRDVDGEVFGERDCAVDLEFRGPVGAAIPSAGTVHRQTCNGWVIAPLPEQAGPAQLRVTVEMSGFEPLVIAQPIVLAGNA